LKINFVSYVDPTRHQDGGEKIFMDVIRAGITRGHPFSISSTRPSKKITYDEKPDAKTAQAYVDDGSYFWNSGIKLCESHNRQYWVSHGIDYRSVMPTNLYELGDNYHPENSHVIPALIRRFHEAKVSNSPEVVIWGSGMPKREFLYVDDMASASVFVMNLDKSIYDQFTEPMQSHFNIGYGADISIAQLAAEVKSVTGFGGAIKFDALMLDGAPRKLMDSNKINQMGWHPKISLGDGLRLAYVNFLKKLSI